MASHVTGYIETCMPNMHDIETCVPTTWITTVTGVGCKPTMYKIKKNLNMKVCSNDGEWNFTHPIAASPQMFMKVSACYYKGFYKGFYLPFKRYIIAS